MSLERLRVLLTGATGGIGTAMARALAARGASLLLTARDAAALERLERSLALPPGRSLAVAADLADPASRGRLVHAALGWGSGVNTLVNNAGLGQFGLFAESTPQQVEALFAANVTAPIHLTRALLPRLLEQPEAHVVNVGSVLGSIGYPGQALYCASKFALRGFSEALARELSDTRVRVHYLAPRATRTAMNAPQLEAMNAALGVATDPPERVAAALCALLERGRARATVGWPERLFVRLNGLLPGLVDRAVASQLPVVRAHAAKTGETAEAVPVEVSNTRAV